MSFFKIYRQLFCCFILGYLARDVTSQKNESCYADNSNPYIYTGTKTAYQYIHNNVTERVKTLPNCKPIYIWMLCRHGTRNTRQDTITKMLNLTYMRDLIIENHKIHKQGYLCDQDLQNLENWSPDDYPPVQDHKYLTSQGRKDLSTLGERLRIRFPEFFNANKPENYEFTSTDTQRTTVSMKSFISGAFGDDFAANIQINKHLNNNIMLQSINTCQIWRDERNRTRAMEQVQEFIDGPEMTKLVADVSRRLGFASSINKYDIFLLYDTCRFEKAWYPDRLSPWCAMFTDDEMSIFEYEEDLHYYYYFGYGLKINKKFGCRTMLDMFDRFIKLEHAEDTDELKGLFHFSHSAEVMQFFTSVGIGKDTMPLTSKNYKDMANRNWRTSLLVPFAANFVAIFYRCESEDSPFKVASYLDEYPVTLEGCENEVCDWTKLKETLLPVVKNCDMEHCRSESI